MKKGGVLVEAPWNRHSTCYLMPSAWHKFLPNGLEGFGDIASERDPRGQDLQRPAQG